jgi:hypothetical protein
MYVLILALSINYHTDQIKSLKALARGYGIDDTHRMPNNGPAALLNKHLLGDGNDVLLARRL